MEAQSIITQIIDGEGFHSFTPFEKTYLLEKQGITSGQLILDDGRKISAVQRKHIYATFNDISAYAGHMPDEIKELMKYQYIAETGYQHFSLSDCDMTTARLFLQFLIEFCLEWNVPTKDSLRQRCPDIAQYIYACLVYKKCCVSGRKAELHHVDAVGMGNNRNEISHAGMRAMPLTRQYHTEAHTIGQAEFDDKYKVFGIPLDNDLCKMWKVKGN